MAETWVDLNVKSPEELDPKKEYRALWYSHWREVYWGVNGVPYAEGGVAIAGIIKAGCPLQVRESQPQEPETGYPDWDERAKMRKLIECARSFVKVADEFFPGYPEALGEHYEALQSADIELAAFYENRASAGTSLPVGEEEGPEWNLHDHLEDQHRWSIQTFGAGRRTKGNLKHIEKEIREVRKEPDSLEEWVDIALLAFDGAMRAGHSPCAVCRQLERKLKINKARTWPAPNDGDSPVEHVRASSVPTTAVVPNDQSNGSESEEGVQEFTPETHPELCALIAEANREIDGEKGAENV